MGADMEWRDQAACRTFDEHDLDATFFPHPNDQGLDAKRICIDCPVVDACLLFALETRQEHGVWGCMTSKQRAQLLAKRTKRRMNPPTPDERCGSYPGSQAHRKRDEALCDDCKDARNEYEAPKKRARRAAARLGQAS